MPSRLLTLVLLSSLCACGGGGGGGSAGGSGGGFEVAPTLRGVAATGAPLVNAQVSVVDGSGASMGSATTHAADGSYSLSLSSKSPTAPLFVQVRGLDAGGQMRVLHSVVPAPTAASSPTGALVANITPLSNAAVALALGADPAPVFAAASANAAALSSLASTAAAAAEFLKTLFKTQLTDLKITDAKALDLYADASFAANKGAQDLLIESLRVDLARSTRDVPVLQLANKLIASSAAEVVVELPTAKAELLKSAGAPATAISSILKATTSPTAVLANLASLDELSAALNQLIAQGRDPSSLLQAALVTGYDKHNAKTKADLAGRLYELTQANRQFGRWQVLGCADDAPAAGNCSRLLVGATLSDASGTVVDLFADAVSYNKAATTTNKWNLIGNGKKLAVAVHPLAFTALAGDGTKSGALSPNPGIGLQVEIQAQVPAELPTDPAVKLMDSATVQLPGGFSIPFGYCSRPHLCVSTTPGATSLIATGGVGDTAIQRSAVGWIGSAESLRGARFGISYTTAGVAETRTAWLRADVLAEPGASRFPTLDGVSATNPVAATALQAGSFVATWSTWAAANPDMRLIELRRVFAPATGSPSVLEIAAPLPPSTRSPLSGSFTPSAAVTSELWLGAQDANGRRYYTRYTAQP